MTNQPTQISLDKAYEIRHWMAILQLNEPELYAAVRQVGKGLAALKQHCACVDRPLRVRL